MEGLELLIDFHLHAERQGPGSSEATARALALAGIDVNAPLRIADIGCGTGASALALARLTNASITAVDFLQAFLDKLTERAAGAGLSDRITPVCASMDQLPFEPDQFDVIWSEGAIYNMGFKQGVTDWRQYLAPDGLLVVSEITWITADRPAELQQHWQQQYTEIDTASAKMKVLESCGYSPVGYFVLPESCWLNNYYDPMRYSFEAFLARHDNSELAQQLVESERQEIALYEQHREYFSYGVYVAKKSR